MRLKRKCSNTNRPYAIGSFWGVLLPIGGAVALALWCGASLPAGAGDQTAPRFSKAGELFRPKDYREWVYVTSGLGMTYGTPQPSHSPMFDNVFVTRSAYREFLRSGVWPEKTVLILEARHSEEKVSINNGGRTQGELAAVEAAVKDKKRFPEDGWGYFSFDGEHGLAERAALLPRTASCYACHKNNGAVENTFVQFYPTLFEVAKRFRTVKPTYDPNRFSREK